MSAAGDDLARRLLASARRERPSQALRERVLALGRTGLARDELPLAEDTLLRDTPREHTPREHTPRERAPRARVWVACLACAAGVCVAAWGASERAAPLAISAERPPRVEASPAALAAASGAVSPREPEAPALPAPVEPRAPAARPPQSKAQENTPERAPPERPRTRHEPAKRHTDQDPSRLLEEQRAPRVAPSIGLGEQLARLKSARAMLRAGDAAGALRVLDAYRDGAHGGELGAEAALLRIEALAASGERESAASAARRFMTEHPTSPLIDRARSFAVEAPTVAP